MITTSLYVCKKCGTRRRITSEYGRRRPVRHEVSGYKRKNGTKVGSHSRGSGTKMRKRNSSKVVGRDNLYTPEVIEEIDDLLTVLVDSSTELSYAEEEVEKWERSVVRDEIVEGELAEAEAMERVWKSRVIQARDQLADYGFPVGESTDEQIERVETFLEKRKKR